MNFLKAHGTGTAPLPDRWMQAGSALVSPGRTGFPRRPRMAPGDRLVLYASGWRCVFGVAPRSMSQQSHIRIEPRHLELALEALAGVGR